MTHATLSLYTYSCLIPFHLADPAGILFFGNVFTLTHQAFEHFIIQQLKLPWKEWFQNPRWIVPIKHTQAEYFYPIYAGQDCRIELSIAAMSTSSLTLVFSFYQDRLSCTVQTVHVFCDRQTQQKMPIPPKLLHLLTGVEEELSAK